MTSDKTSIGDRRTCASGELSKKAYEPPVLTKYGDVAAITRGAGDGGTDGGVTSA